MSAPAPAPPRPATERRVEDNPHGAQDVRRTLLALLASAMGVLPLCELISDLGWLIDVWVTMIVVIAPAAYLRSRRPPSSGQIWLGLALMVPWLTVRFLHQHAFGGIIPTAATWHDLAQLMSNLHHTTTVESAPVHSTTAIKLALCMLLGLVAALVDLVAVVGRRGALGGVPLLVVFTVSGAVPRRPVSWWLFALAAGGFLILLALDSSDDLHRWGHYVPRQYALKSRTAETGQRIAVAAIALAVILPVFVPSDSRNWLANLFHNSTANGLDTGIGRGGGTGGIDPFVALKGQLDRKVPSKLFDVTVHSGSGAVVGPNSPTQLFYARSNVLSRFTGNGWVVGGQGALESIAGSTFSSSPGVSFPPATAGFSVHVKITNLHSSPPLFAVPTSISGLGAATKWSLQDQLLEDSTISPGDSYDMNVAQPEPTVDELEAAAGVDRAMTPWLELPPIAQYVRDLVTTLTARAQTPYEKALALNNYFTDPRNGFTYSLATQRGDTGDELVDFLHNKFGFCQQYAAAMGVMLRVAGVPSRVVLGYTHAAPSSDGTFTITTNDAHSWVEAYFTGVGWIPFDPTPLAGITGGAANDLPWARHKDDGGRPSTGPSVSNPAPVRPTTHALTSSAAPVQASGGSGSGLLGGSLLALGIVGLLILLALIPWAVRQRRRSGRLRRARNGDVDALWAEFSDTATDLGYVWAPSRTPRQVGQWLAGSAGAGAQALRELTSSVELRRYARDGQVVDGRRLVGALATVRQGLQAGRPWRERLGARLLPASLGWPVLSMLRGRRLRLH